MSFNWDIILSSYYKEYFYSITGERWNLQVLPWVPVLVEMRIWSKWMAGLVGKSCFVVLQSFMLSSKLIMKISVNFTFYINILTFFNYDKAYFFTVKRRYSEK